MQYSVISNCLRTLDVNVMDSSSEKFEYEATQSLADQSSSPITIFSSVIEHGNVLLKNNIKIIGYKGKSTKDSFCNLFNHLKANSKEDDVVIFYGYDLMNIIQTLAFKKNFKLRLICYIFDTHKGAIEHYSFVKKVIAKIYFQVAILLLKYIDGYIIFQLRAKYKLRINKEMHLSKPGIDPNRIAFNIYCRTNKEFTITYIGSLMPYNGIQELIQSVLSINNIRLKIYGEGIMKDYVIKSMQKNSKIYYGGLLKHEKVLEEIKNSDLLVNLRDPNHYINDFSFPSKLLEFMLSGIPVLSTNLNFEKELIDSIYTIDSLDSMELSRAINVVMNESQDVITKKTNNAREYIINNYSWDKISKEIIKYISRI